MIDLLEIKDPSFIKDLSIKELKELANQIRQFLIENISKTGGHLSSNLGVVELTIAMYYVFDPKKDKFLFDVGHQSYVHKILTGRAKDFVHLRQIDGMSGYIRRSESKYDVWESGHSSTSISAASGMILANSDSRVVSVIGDSSMMNGIAFEAINFLGQLQDKNPIIILNDNRMGISKSVGAFTKVFQRIRGAKIYRGVKRVFNFITPNFLNSFYHQIKRGLKGFFQRDNIFEELGFDYYGPYNGNNLKYCIKVMNKIKNAKGPIVLHLLTKKGKGYEFSEKDEVGSFHGIEPFDIKTGKPLVVSNKVSYSKLVADTLVKRREKEEFFVVTPAMKAGSKLDEFANLYPKSFYDVGIAEEHAAVMAAGMALENKKVVLLMYSTFSQRAFDQILNDISRQNLKVIIGLDRAGIVGEDGSTHQGVYDISMMSLMPNIKIFSPRNPQEVIGVFNWAFDNLSSPIAIRYPRASFEPINLDYNYISTPKWELVSKGTKANVISFGPDVERINNLGLDVNLYDAKIIKPIDKDTLKEIFDNNLPIIVIEQCVDSGSLYDKLLEFKEENNYNSKIYHFGFTPDTIITHGKIEDVYKKYGLSEDALKEFIEEKYKG